MQDKILETPVTLPLREILGMAPELQKRFAALTRTRKEAASWSVEAIETGEQGIEDDARTSYNEDPGSAMLAYTTAEELYGLLERYAGAVAIGSKRFYAMACGFLHGKFGTEQVTFLVDSGSELNLITRRIWEQAGVDMDEDGSRWSLRGINGDPVPLLGCCRDAPVEIGGKQFDHHFFVSNREFGNYDGILGQPWLQWNSTQVEYTRGGQVDIVVYPTGDKSGEKVKLKILGTSHPRNSERLVMEEPPKQRLVATIEEVSDEGF